MVPGSGYYARRGHFGRCRHPALFHRQQNAGEAKLDGQSCDCLSDVRNRMGDVAAALSAAVVCRDRCGNLQDRKSTRLNSSHLVISYAVFCLKKKKKCLKYSQLLAVFIPLRGALCATFLAATLS